MKIFSERHYREAMDFADQGHEALHVFSQTIYLKDGAEEDVPMAHLYDRNLGRLVTTAIALGLTDPPIMLEGRRGQHILLSGPKLVERAIDLVHKPKPPQWGTPDVIGAEPAAGED